MYVTPYERRRNEMSTFDPFGLMRDFEHGVFGDRIGSSFCTDIREENGAYLLEADLPGFKKEDIHIDLEDNRMTITAERHSDYEEKDKKGSFLRCERSYGAFSRSFDTTGIDVAAIKASFTDGVLRLTMPKIAEVPPTSRRLEIE